MVQCKWILPFFVMLFLSTTSQFIFGQSKSYSISGYIKEKNSGESVNGAIVKVTEDQKNYSVLSNVYGYYSLKVPAGINQIIVTHIAFQDLKLTVNIFKDTVLELKMLSKETQLAEIVVESAKKDNFVNKTTPGFEKFNIKTLDKIPVLFGERDIIKSLQLLPGVKSISEGSSGISVRGGTDAQNLYLLDEAIVYNPSHFGGLFSSFNSDALKDVQLYKGYAPAQFGGRLSSVLDIRMKDGNNKAFHGEGGIGLISSRLSLEGPFVKDKSSWIISGRRTYFDAFLPLAGENYNGITAYFYDLNAKSNFILSKKTKLFISGYFGQDKLALNQTFGVNWGNQTLTTRLNHLFNNRFFSNSTLIYSNYDYIFNIRLADVGFQISSSISDFSFKQDMEYFINNYSKMKFGAWIYRHRINPGRFDAVGNNLFPLTPSPARFQYSLEYGVYYNHELKLTEKLGFNYGLRLNQYQLLGPTTLYTYDNSGKIKDSSSYKKNQTVVTYLNIEPRFALNIQLSKISNLKIALSRNSQNLHLLSNSNVATPSDLWVSNTLNIKPEYANELSIGYYSSIARNLFEYSVETYYKDLENQIDFKPGAILRANLNVESEILFGRGRAFGLELYFRKKIGKLTGWISYTISRVEKKIAGINNGNYFPATQNRTHEVAIVGNYDFNSRWSVASNFIYYTGNAATYPSGKYSFQNIVYFSFPAVNSFNLPPYNRLDISAVYNFKKYKKNHKLKKLNSSLSFGVYNVYGRQNPYSISFNTDEKNSKISYAEQTSLYQFVPYITWNFKF